MKILLITQHGDERLGQRLYRFLQRKEHGSKYKDVDFLCGNPKAYQANVRYIESDLNRSYGVEKPRAYEEKRARRVLAMIGEAQYDYVLDIHTSRSPCGSLLIVANLNTAVQDMIAATRMKRIVVMSPDIAAGSLIGNVANAVSFEYDRQIADSRETLAELVDVIDALFARTREEPFARDVFFVDSVIRSDASIDAHSKNFEKCNLGFYPVLFRERGGSYKGYKGFAAGRKEEALL